MLSFVLNASASEMLESLAMIISLRSLILDLAAYNQQLDINRDCEAETQQAEYLMIDFSAHNSKYMDLIITKI